MKVLHIFHELKFSGAEIMYVDAASYFQENGCELSVIATAKEIGDYAPHFKKSGYEVIHMPYPFGYNYFAKIKYLMTLIALIRRENYKIIHIHNNSIMWEMTLCSWMARKRSVHTFHSVFKSRFFSYPIHIMQRWIAKNIFGCRFHTISDSVYENELKRYYNQTNKIFNWYGHRRFYPAENGEREKLRAELEIPHDALVLISIGGCSHIKRHSEIIKSLPYVLKSKLTTIYLHLGEGEIEKEEIELAKKLNIYENIRFCKNQTELRKFIVASDIYLMTSKHEGMPITTIESMACGVPTILYDVPGLRDFNKTGTNSLLIPEDYKTLGEKIIWLYSNQNIAKKLSDQALKLVTNTYYLPKNASKILELYTSDK